MTQAYTELLYLFKMATAKLTQHMDFRHTESELNAVIISDSYLKYYYFHCDQIVGNTIQLGTHVHNLDNGTSLNYLVLNNQSKGGNTINQVLNNSGFIYSWAENLPNITIVHLGACDIANQEIDNTKEYKTKILNLMESLTTLGRKHLENNENKIKEFDTKMTNHRFLLIGVPDWGEFGDGKYDHSLNGDQYRQLRRKINSTLNNIRSHIWHDYKAAVFTPDMANAKRVGVHLDSKTSSSEYSSQIAKAAARLVCTRCNFNSSYDKNQHKHDSLLEPCIEQAQP